MSNWLGGYLTAMKHMAQLISWVNPITVGLFATALSAFATVMAWRVSAKVAEENRWDRLFRAQSSARAAALELHQKAAFAHEVMRPAFESAEQQVMLRGLALGHQIKKERNRLEALRQKFMADATGFMATINSSTNAFEIEVGKGEIDLAMSALDTALIDIRRTLHTHIERPTGSPSKGTGEPVSGRHA